MKRIFYISILIFAFSLNSSAQAKSPSEGSVKLIKLYPIPANTVINFDFISGYNKTYSFQIFNFIGKKVFELKNPPQKINLTLNDFTRGFYYYQISDANGRVVETARFLVLK